MPWLLARKLLVVTRPTPPVVGVPIEPLTPIRAELWLSADPSFDMTSDMVKMNDLPTLAFAEAQHVRVQSGKVVVMELRVVEVVQGDADCTTKI